MLSPEIKASRQDFVVIPIAGGLTPDLEKIVPGYTWFRFVNPWLSLLDPAETQFGTLPHSLKMQGMQVLRPLVPAKLGFEDPEVTNRQMSEKIHGFLDKHPGKLGITLGISLGGLHALRQALESTRIVGSISMSTPHVAEFDDEWFKGMARSNKRLSGQLNEFTERSRWIAKKAGNDAIKHLVGSTGDSIVPAHAALPEINDTSRTLLTANGIPETLSGKFTVIRTEGHVDHADYGFQRQAIDFIVDTTVSIVDAAIANGVAAKAS